MALDRSQQTWPDWMTDADIAEEEQSLEARLQYISELQDENGTEDSGEVTHSRERKN